LRLQKDPTPSELTTALKQVDLSQYDEAAIVGFGEPLMNLDGTLASAEYLSSNELPVRINSNGHARLFYPDREVARELSESGVSEIQISLNASNAQTYVKLCRPSYGAEAFLSLLDFAEDCTDYMKVVFSVVKIPGIDINACRELAREFSIELRVRDFKGSLELMQEIAAALDE
jgi:TatD family-associated radical SAM protein